MPLLLYDTTLRDGTQREGLSLSVDDKLKIARRLDAFGVHYIEGGWPGSNPKDAEFFQRIREVPLRHARVAAFGSTRRAGGSCDTDGNVRTLLDAETPVVTLVGKSSAWHVERVLETSREENLRMIAETVAYFVALGKEVVFDAEHFFDGWRLDHGYAFETVTAAAEAGASCVALCDTNGGSLPNTVSNVVRTVRGHLHVPLGIHTHDDCGLALANALAALDSGCEQVQGTINGYGERCGNLDLVRLVATLQLKKGVGCVRDDALASLRDLSHVVAAIANLNPDPYAPFVGRSAFAHKGGLHAAAFAKEPASYQHIDPALIGNAPRLVVSELAGRSTIRARARALGLDDVAAGEVLAQVKEFEHEGAQFEAADGSFEMLVRRVAPDHEPAFELVEYTTSSQGRGNVQSPASAEVTLRIGDRLVQARASGTGPVHALDRAVREALLPTYPQLAGVRLADYKVRIVDEHLGTAARTRVLIESVCGDEWWSTVGWGADVIEASWRALRDALELPLVRARDGVVAAAEHTRIAHLPPVYAQPVR
jgi:2-isopropylmalate synthase